VPADLRETTPKIPLHIAELRQSDVEHLRLGFWSRLSESDVERVVDEFPGLSVWVPETLEYAIASPWRHRAEIMNVLALSAARHPAELLDSVARNCARSGAKLVISIEIDEIRHPAFYERTGFDPIEEVITYDLESRYRRTINGERLAFRRVDASRQHELDLLVELDHAAFPWIWRNSAAEFQAYAEDPGVELFVGYHSGEPICYAGITAYLGWGHIDRIAVLPGKQSHGFGAETLGFIIDRLVKTGASRIGLSTQLDNLRSQRLYERFGFTRGTQNCYRIYGRKLSEVEQYDVERGKQSSDVGRNNASELAQ
jgi:ribosomal protein S18 acetylase RimI-like enzyme